MADLQKPPYQNKVCAPDGYMDKGWLAFFLAWAKEILSGFVQSVTGTAGRIQVTGTAINPIVNIDPAYVGQTSITTLGTVTTGTWHGTPIEAAHGGTGQVSYLLGDTLYASGPATLSKLAGSTQDFPVILTQTGTGVASAAPAWMTRGNLMTWIDVREYGAGAPGVTDNVPPLRLAAAALQAAGGGILYIPPINYDVFGNTTGTREIIFDLVNLTGVTILCGGSTFTNTRAFANQHYGEIFRFTGCSNVTIGDVYGTTTVPLPDYAATYKERGVEMFNIYQGCKNIRFGNIKLYGMRLGIGLNRLYNDPESYRTINLTWQNIDSYMSAYCVNDQFSGVNVTGQINAVRSHRTYSVYGARAHRVVINSCGNDGNDAFVGSFSGVGCEDMHIRYRNTMSNADNPAQPAAAGCALYFGDQTPGTHRNINFDLGVKYNEAGGYLGAALEIYNQDNSGVYDTVDRGHTIDGLTITGTVIGNPGPGNSPPVLTNGSWSGTGPTPNSVRNVKVHDLYLSSTASANFGFLGALAGSATFDNVECDASIYPGENPEGSKIAFINCRAQNFTSATTDEGFHDYYGCNITDGSLQSILNKRFEAKTLKADSWQPNAQEWIGAYSANATSDARVLLNDGVNGDPLIPSSNMQIEGRMLAGGAASVVRNAFHWLVFTASDTLFSAVQGIFGQSNNISSRFISLALLADGSLSLRRQSAATSGIPTASTLLDTELVNISDTQLKTPLQLLIENDGGGPGAGALVSAANPAMALQQTGAAADNRIWDWLATSEQFQGRAVNDANTASGKWVIVDRTGTTIDLVNFPGTAIKAAALSGTGNRLAQADTNGQLTATLAAPVSSTFSFALGGCTTAPTGTARYTVFGNVVTLTFPSLTETSNTTDLTYTGLPAALQPVNIQYFTIPSLVDNGAFVTLKTDVSVTNSGTVTFQIGDNPSGFTNSGTKGVGHQFTITYLLQ